MAGVACHCRPVGTAIGAYVDVVVAANSDELGTVPDAHKGHAQLSWWHGVGTGLQTRHDGLSCAKQERGGKKDQHLERQP